MKLRTLIGAGDLIMGFALPFALVGIILNVLYPEFFRMNLGQTGTIVGIFLMALGVPLWFMSVVQILLYVPRSKLITKGPFAIVFHPIYTFVSLLVIPGVTFVCDTWVGFVIGAVLYFFSRLFSGKEEKILEETFGDEYRSYRTTVLLPWV